MAKYSELGNVKFTLRIVAQFLCGTRADSGQNDCGTRVALWLNLTFPNMF